MYSWLFVGTLFILCGVLGFLQYRWTGEVSLAERERLRTGLRSSLLRLSQDFNAEIATACRAIMPRDVQPGVQDNESEIAARFADWKKTTRHGRLFDRVALAFVQDDESTLHGLDAGHGIFMPSEWPPEWMVLKQWFDVRTTPGRGPRRDFLPRPPRGNDPLTIVLPLFEMPRPGSGPDRPFQREPRWLILDLNLQYLRDSILPELIQRHLGAEGDPDYIVEIVTRTDPPVVIYESDPGRARVMTAAEADASVALLDLRYEQLRRWAPPGAWERGPGQFLGREGAPFAAMGPGPGAGFGVGFGRWQMFVRHRAGSLEAVVSRARWRNLAVTAGLLLLMAATAVALMRYTRRAQRLAELQMGFVAGVSHELRTPLTVIHTAAYNLRGKVAANPAQVERYSVLIRQESGRLKDLVEQVLNFAGAEAGYVIKEREPVCVEAVIEDVIESSKPLIEANHCVVERRIDPALPAVPGDRVALKHALGNLLSNAAKYGSKGGNWIGVFASTMKDQDQPAVEVRIADRGPGIPADEQDQIFDAFFRGQSAIQDQVHGTGLGLNLAKLIVEAHGGSIQVKSEPMKGTEFTVRLPALAVEV